MGTSVFPSLLRQTLRDQLGISYKQTYRRSIRYVWSNSQGESFTVCRPSGQNRRIERLCESGFQQSWCLVWRRWADFWASKGSLQTYNHPAVVKESADWDRWCWGRQYFSSKTALWNGITCSGLYSAHRRTTGFVGGWLCTNVSLSIQGNRSLLLSICRCLPKKNHTYVMSKGDCELLHHQPTQRQPKAWARLVVQITKVWKCWNRRTYRVLWWEGRRASRWCFESAAYHEVFVRYRWQVPNIDPIRRRALFVWPLSMHWIRLV